jgi:hypothetical protein
MTRDLRKYTRSTTTRLIAGGFLLVFILGDGLIYLFYGPNAAISGLLCLGIAVLPLLLIFLAFWLIDTILKQANKD